MPTYQVQQTWRAKRPKTVVSHDFENPPQPSKNEFAEGCRKSNSILKLEHLQRVRREDVIWSIWSLGATSNLTQFYFKFEVK